MKKKPSIWLEILGTAALILVIGGRFFSTQSLEDVINEPFWSSSSRCKIVNTSPLADYHFETDLTFSAHFAHVKVKGPYEKKTSAFNGDWIEISAVIPEENQKDAYASLQIDVFREKPSVDSSEFTEYSFNIGTQSYKVTDGQQEIDAFVDLMRLQAEKG